MSTWGLEQKGANGRVYVQGELFDDGAEILVVGNVGQGMVVVSRVDALVARHVGGRVACRGEVELAAAIEVGKVEPVLRHSSRSRLRAAD